MSEPKRPDTLEEDEGFAEKFQEFMGELNIRGSTVFKIFGFLVGVAAVIIGGIYGWRYFASPQEGATPSPEQAPVQQDTGVPAAADIGSPENITPRLVGFTGVESAVFVGTVSPADTPITRYITIFQRLENTYNVDIIAMLNSATDRRARLEAHIALLRRLSDDANELFVKLKSQRAALELAYEPEQKIQDAAEANFFEQLNALNSEIAQELLETFIASSKRGVELRARFKALGRMEGLYAGALPKVAKRLQDIELNKEALIAGIKVYDVRDSDLKLVVPLDSPAAPAANPGGR